MRRKYPKTLDDYRAIEARLPPASADLATEQFAPPDRPVLVKCTHCGGIYSSSEIVPQYRLHLQALTVRIVIGDDLPIEELTPLWWCRNETCDGAGFGFDIFEEKS